MNSGYIPLGFSIFALGFALISAWLNYRAFKVLQTQRRQEIERMAEEERV